MGAKRDRRGFDDGIIDGKGCGAAPRSSCRQKLFPRPLIGTELWPQRGAEQFTFTRGKQPCGFEISGGYASLLVHAEDGDGGDIQQLGGEHIPLGRTRGPRLKRRTLCFEGYDCRAMPAAQARALHSLFDEVRKIGTVDVTARHVIADEW